MYGHWIGPVAVGNGVDHVHTCTRCLDDVACTDAYLDCPRYLGIVTTAFVCACVDEQLQAGVCPVELGALLIAAAERAGATS